MPVTTQRPILSGLSPRVRGNLRDVIWYVAHSGSIPACAGEPPGGSAWDIQCTVYPRVCGGTMQSLPRELMAKGLSPRVRGNRFSVGHRHEYGGSIPACAGEPGRYSGSAASLRVYPRVCGGT